jgi:uncharacterized protein (DUF983 family)
VPSLRTAVWRGLKLRCPQCGKSRFYRFWGLFADDCPACGHVYLRDPGDWTGSAETSFILTVAAGGATYLFLPAEIANADERIGISVAVAAWVFAIIFPRIRGAWIGVLSLWADPRHKVSPGVDPVEGQPGFEHPTLYGDSERPP